MRVKSLKVSNILSYSNLADFENAPNTIEFNKGLNVLIGANGSGKSNMIEIISRLFTNHFMQSFSRNDDNKEDPFNYAKVIQISRPQQSSGHLSINFNSNTTEAKINIKLEITAGDLSNIRFFKENIIKLISLEEKYSSVNFFKNFQTGILRDAYLIEEVEYTFHLYDKSKGSGEFHIRGGFESTSFQNFFHDYFYNFNAIQHLIDLGNTYEGCYWPKLRNPFALISSMRTFGGFPTIINFAPGLNDRFKEIKNNNKITTRDYVPTEFIYSLSNLEAGQYVRHLSITKSKSDALKDLLESKDSPLYKIKSALKKHLDFELQITSENFDQDTARIEIKHRGKKIRYDTFSTGQKNIFYLLFSIYAYNLKDGLILIDEPELHLHIAMQKKYLDILTTVLEECNIQVILATHSGIFINEKTISHTYRFFKENDETKVVAPSNITQPIKDLVKILTYTNSSRIFFADQVLLVEGDSDEYFYSYFYRNHIQLRHSANQNLEILYIGGKGNYFRWRDFLELFRIQTYFLGDWDNVREFGVISRAGIDWDQIKKSHLSMIIKKIDKEAIKNRGTKDGAQLLELIEKIINNDFILSEDVKTSLTALWEYLLQKQGLKASQLVTWLKGNNQLAQVEAEINKLYKEGVFILKNGDLEAYLNISKDLKNVIEFCENSFESWLSEETEKVRELEKIFGEILGLKE